VSEKTIVVIVGPPAVGKMAVGRELERRTGIPLLHNHMTIDLVLPFFEFGSEPFSRLVGGFRKSIINEVAASDHAGLIFTYVWAFDQISDLSSVEKLLEPFVSGGGRGVFVELYAPLEIRLERNDTPLRLLEKPSKRDVAASRARLIDIDTRHRMNSDGDFPYEDHLLVDTTKLSVEQTADLVIEHFSLPTR
jgi:hypothetical protein